jgi:hypothetical protein
MKRFRIFIFFLSVVVSNVQSLHRDTKTTQQRLILHVDHRSYHDDIIGEGSSRSEESLRGARCDCDQNNLWEKLQKGSEAIIKLNKTGAAFPKEYIIAQSDIPKLEQIWKNYSNKDDLRDIAIKMEIAPTTKFEMIKDRLLFSTPIALSMVYQDVMLDNVGGFKGGIIGVMGGFAIGEWVHPLFDSYNSGVGKLAKNFGSTNHYPNRRGLYFAMNACQHYVLAGIYSKLCDYQSSVLCVCGKLLVCIFRGICYYLPTQELREYQDPFDRTNAGHTFFTFGNLAAHNGW